MAATSKSMPGDYYPDYAQPGSPRSMARCEAWRCSTSNPALAPTNRHPGAQPGGGPVGSLSFRGVPPAGWR